MLRRSGCVLGSTRRLVRKGKPGDNTPIYDNIRGPVEWLPRPVRLPWSTVDEARDWMMRATLDGQTAEFDNIRELQRQWGQMPLRPVLGDVEPKFPRQVYKDNHQARRKFILRWHKANSPNVWQWLPRTGNAPEHRANVHEYPEYWGKRRPTPPSPQQP